MNKKECFITGTRPDIIKFAPLIKKIEPFVIHTGQHSELADEAFKMFNIRPDVDLQLMTKNQTLSDFISKCISALDKVFRNNKYDRVWVLGDTSTSLAAALAAYNNKIPIVHVEAGLRSHDKDNPYPEEVFRTMIDKMSDYLFAPTNRAVNNLLDESITKNVFCVGNTIVDALEMIKPKLSDRSPQKEKFVLATIHRRESFGNEMSQIFLALKELSKEIKVILPAHPNPNIQKIIKRVGLETVEPMNYKDFLWHMKHCEYIISDSGGIQEEAPSFRKKIVVLRKATERQELIDAGYGILVKQLKKGFILEEVKKFINTDIEITHNPFGQGWAADNIINLIFKKNEKVS